MKLKGLRAKLFVLSTAFTLCIAFLLGYTVYQVSENLFYKIYRNDAMNTVRLLSADFPTDRYLKWAESGFSNSSFFPEETARFQKFMSLNPSIHRIFTLLYQPSKGDILYLMDSDISENDRIVFSRSSVEFIIDLDPARTQIQFGEKRSSNFLMLRTPETFISVSLSPETNGWLLRMGKERMNILTRPGVSLETPFGILDHQNPLLVSPDGWNIRLVEKGQPLRQPGSVYTSAENLKEALYSGDGSIVFQNTGLSQSESIEVCSIFQKSRGNPSVMLGIEYSDQTLSDFRNSFLFVGLIIALFSFVATFLFTLFQAQYFITPIRIISNGVKQVTDGNLRTKISLKRSDEFGKLAEGFNTMTQSIYQNIAELKTAEAKLKQIAYYDELTGLLNRKAFYDKFNDTLIHAKRYREEFLRGFLFIELDRFKSINDTMGHRVGDEVLRSVARRLKGSLRESDYLFRIGGDEFAVILNHLTRDTDAAIIAEKILRVMNDALSIEGKSIYLGSSIGISIYPKDGEDADILIRKADTALYEAKKERRTYRFFTEDMQERAENKIRISSGIHRALDLNEMLLYYQPQVRSDGEVTGGEALLRWKHPELGYIPPDQFIPIAEETGSIIKIGEWVFEEACRFINKNRPLFEGGRSLSVNLSVKQFLDQSLAEKLRKLLEYYQIETHQLRLEITESCLMEQIDENIDKITQIRSLGVPISLDDFGTGYSSLAYLKRLPIDVVKIDRSFITGIPENEEDCVLVKTIINIAKEFGYQLVAEGVETSEQAEFLYRHGCEHIQGYYFSRPLPADEFIEYLKKSARSEK